MRINNSGFALSVYRPENKALNLFKNGRFSGHGNIWSEFLKQLDGKDIQWLIEIFNKIYSSGEIPKIWLKSAFATLPKKANARKCGYFRTVSLMSHRRTLFLIIIYQRIYGVYEEQIDRSQFGFRNAFGKREVLFSMRVFFQGTQAVNNDVFACFID